MDSKTSTAREFSEVIAREVGHISRGCRSGRSHNPSVHEQAIEDALAALVEQVDALQHERDQLRTALRVIRDNGVPPTFGGGYHAAREYARAAISTPATNSDDWERPSGWRPPNPATSPDSG